MVISAAADVGMEEGKISVGLPPWFLVQVIVEDGAEAFRG